MTSAPCVRRARHWPHLAQKQLPRVLRARQGISLSKGGAQRVVCARQASFLLWEKLRHAHSVMRVRFQETQAVRRVMLAQPEGTATHKKPRRANYAQRENRSLPLAVARCQVSSYYYISSVLILLYIQRPHTTIYSVSSYYYISSVLMLLYI